MKKKLTLNKRTIQNLGHNQDNVLGSDEMGVIKAGLDTSTSIRVGTSRHPKYC
jgi:hypothetical protein